MDSRTPLDDSHRGLIGLDRITVAARLKQMLPTATLGHRKRIELAIISEPTPSAAANATQRTTSANAPAHEACTPALGNLASVPAHEALTPAPHGSRTVWMYWEKAPGAAVPELVTRCLASARRHSTTITLLDEESIKKYVTPVSGAERLAHIA